MGLFSYFPGIFNYYHLSLLLTSLNCVADPALYCFVSESARRGLYGVIFRPVARILCRCCRRGNASPSNPATDSHEVATDENNGHPSVMLLTLTNTVSDVKADTFRENTSSVTQTHKRTIITLNEQHSKHNCVDSDGKTSCVIAIEEQDQKTERTEGNDKNAS